MVLLVLVPTVVSAVIAANRAVTLIIREVYCV
jgi:hypothetical protein